MVKKILSITLFLTFSLAFSQRKSVSDLKSVPNPFNKRTEISFTSTKTQGILLVVKNIIGKTVFQKTYWTQKGVRKIVFKKDNLKPGIYIYSIQSNENIISKRFVIN